MQVWDCLNYPLLRVRLDVLLELGVECKCVWIFHCEFKIFLPAVFIYIYIIDILLPHSYGKEWASYRRKCHNAHKFHLLYIMYTDLINVNITLIINKNLIYQIVFHKCVSILNVSLHLFIKYCENTKYQYFWELPVITKSCTRTRNSMLETIGHGLSQFSPIHKVFAMFLIFMFFKKFLHKNFPYPIQCNVLNFTTPATLMDQNYEVSYCVMPSP